MIKNYFLKSALFILLITIGIQTNAQNTWDKRESVGGSKRERAVGFSIGTRGYIALGQDTLNQMMNDLWEFDPGTNSWTQKAMFPGLPRRDAVAFTIGNKAYVGTGMSNADAFAGTTLADFWEYNPVTNTWTAKAGYPGGSGFGIYYSSAFSLAGKGYVCCGKQGASSYSNELWQYTPSTNSWAMKAYYPPGVRYGGVAFTIGNYAYYGTGTDENVFTQEFYRYDPMFDVWTAKATFPGSGRFSSSGFSLAGLGYIIFGSDGGYKDELWEYNPASDYWTNQASFPGGARRSSVAFSIGAKAYAGTGKGLTGVRRDFYEYTPSVPMGIEGESNLISSVYPNPMITSLTVDLSPELFYSYQTLSWELTDVTGKLIKTSIIRDQTFSIERNGIAKGVYFFNLKESGNTVATKKIIAQ
jgi:N-acetylneuraminic acid mutarotase